METETYSSQRFVYCLTLWLLLFLSFHGLLPILALWQTSNCGPVSFLSAHSHWVSNACLSVCLSAFLPVCQSVLLCLCFFLVWSITLVVFLYLFYPVYVILMHACICCLQIFGHKILKKIEDLMKDQIKGQMTFKQISGP